MYPVRLLPSACFLVLFGVAAPACGQAPADGDRGLTRVSRGGAARAATSPAPAPTPAPASAAAPAPPAAPRLFPPEIQSLRTKKSVVAWTQPDDKSRPRGTIAADTRVRWLQARAGHGCNGENRYIEVEEGAWVCDKNLEPSTRPPAGVELPRLPPGKLIPGDFATIALPKAEQQVEGAQAYGYRSVRDIQAAASQPTGGAWKCKLDKRPLRVQGKSYWRTDCGGMIFDARFVRKMKPSTWAGVKLADAKLELPIVFASFYGAQTTTLPKGGKKVRTLPARAVLKVLEIKVLHQRGPGRPPLRAYRVGEHEWLLSTRGNLAEAAPPPPGVRDDERWVDVNTDEQVLVAYEGKKPVFATLVSSGKERAPEGKEPTPTEPGVYRIYHKFAETKMSGLEGTDESYYVSKVPWTQYFSGDLALHGAYWHNGFGRTASHGCVNLAPKDARFLYYWTDPPVPLGWSMKAADTDHPGSVVRVRNAKEPTPDVKGYAKRVLKQRTGKTAAAAEEATEAPAIPVATGESARGTP
jgi:lipoprotein-anchoring transpeptidase ErfK/SrfK